MRINKLSEACIQDLQKLIGGRINSIFIENLCPRMSKGKGMHLEGYGLISIIVSNINKKKYFKWRLKHIAVNFGCLYHEFYDWELKERGPQLSFKERLKSKIKNKKNENQGNPKDQNRDFTKSAHEDFDKYDFWLNLIPLKENWENRKEETKIKSIKIYNWVGESDDFLGMIDIETETGRRIVISENDKVDGYDLIIDDEDYISGKLNWIHDDPGITYGKKMFQLRYHFI